MGDLVWRSEVCKRESNGDTGQGMEERVSLWGIRVRIPSDDHVSSWWWGGRDPLWAEGAGRLIRAFKLFLTSHKIPWKRKFKGRPYCCCWNRNPKCLYKSSAIKGLPKGSLKNVVSRVFLSDLWGHHMHAFCHFPWLTSDHSTSQSRWSEWARGWIPLSGFLPGRSLARTSCKCDWMARSQRCLMDAFSFSLPNSCVGEGISLATGTFQRSLW